MGLFVAGVNPRRPVFPSASQHLADAAARRALLGAVSGHRSLSEGLLVAADGRLELYAVADEGCDAYDIAAGLFGAVAEGEVAGALYFAEGIDAASHLFAALCGLDEFARGPGKARRFPGNATGSPLRESCRSREAAGLSARRACRTLWPPVGRAPCRRRGRRPRWAMP